MRAQHRKDQLGNPVTVEDDETLGAIDDFVGGFLAYESRSVAVLAAADQRPDACLANAYAGMIWMFDESPRGPVQARAYLERARRASARATRREALTVELLALWVAGDVPAAQALALQIVRNFPRDLVVVKLAQYLAFNRGDFPAMLRVVLVALPHVADVAWAHGMAAFAYEQCHLLEEAEAAALRALQLNPREPWAQHALAHVMLTQGRVAEGARFLEAASAGWTDLNSFMLTHNWWHLAVFYLSQGREEDALSLWDTRVWGVAKDYSQDQIGAVSLLTRLELAGVQVGDRWQALAPYLAARAQDTVEPFLTLQYLYGLARAGRVERDSLAAAVRDRAETAPAFARAAWRDVARPAAEGLLAYADGDFAAAARRLGDALPRMAEIGGSHAQRDLFALIHEEAVRRSGNLIRAQQLLELRRAATPGDAPANRALVQIYAGLDLPEQAARCAARAGA